MTSGGKSLYRQQPKEDDLQRPHSVRNLVIGTGVLGAITIICWYGTGASSSGNSASGGFIACSAANCPAPTALPMESPAAAQANANGSSGGNPKVIGGSTKRSGSAVGLPPILSVLLDPPTTGTKTVGPVVNPSTSASGTSPTTPAATKTTPAATKTTPAATKSATATPTTVAPTTVAPTTVAPTTVAPTTVAPTTVAPTTVAPTTVAPTTVDPTTVLPTITITASLAVTPTSAGPVSS